MTPLRSDQFVDVAYTLSLVANHGAGRGVRLELLDEADSPTTSTTIDHGVDGTHVHGTSNDHAPRASDNPVTLSRYSGPSSPRPALSPAGHSPSTASSVSAPSTHSTTLSEPAHVPIPAGLTTRSKHGIRHAKKRTDGTIAWSATTTSSDPTLIHTEPRDHHAALSSPYRRTVMEIEFASL
jgi:hypothetical protein